MFKNTIRIAAGECVANALRDNGESNVYAFNEAMCEGDTPADIFAPEFSSQRSKAYDISESEYVHFDRTLGAALKSADRAELYFDCDMFCAANTITLLAYMEKINFQGEINFNLTAQDGTADVIKSFPIKADGFYNVYQKVLVERRSANTGIEHIDRGIALYLNYKKPDNEITRFIKENISLSKKELCIEVLSKFSDYGMGDVAVYKLIENAKK